MGEYLQIEKDGLKLGGKPFYLASGDFHYFRTLPDGWRRRLELMKDFGLTAVQTYVPWNEHEPRPGEFCFEGRLDLAAFLRLCQEVGMKVMLRPAPYMCGEWELGGLPWWLLKDPDICLRTSDPAFMEPVRAYNRRLCQEFVPYLSTNGGPVIAVAIENEYGSYGTDMEYLRQSEEMYRELGVDVPFYAAGGHDVFKQKNGYCGDHIWRGADFGHHMSAEAVDCLRAQQPDKPPFCTEFWAGQIMHWESPVKPMDPEEVARGYRIALDRGAYVNFYMFCGGSDFGFMSGANYYTSYVAQVTSYDYDTLISEDGEPTPMYYACRRQLDEYLGRPVRTHVWPKHPVQTPAPVKMDRSASFFGNLEALTRRCVRHPAPRTMEQMDQDYGFILYTTRLLYTDDRVRHLILDGLHDRALVYVDGEYRGVMMRDRTLSDVTFRVKPEGSTLQILVENMGRMTYGNHLADRKGILTGVRLDIENPDGSFLWNKAFVHNWESRSLPLSDLSGLDFALPPEKDMPGFYQGRFEAQAGVDLFVDTAGWGKGVLWINGVNMGRYWNVGPQRTLYIPGSLIRSENQILLLDLHHDPAVDTVSFSPVHRLMEPIQPQDVHESLNTCQS